MNALEQAKSALKDAIEGECDGIAITDAQAGRILDYLASVQLSALSSAETAEHAPAAFFQRINKGGSGEFVSIRWNIPDCDIPDEGILYAAPQQAAQPVPAGMTDAQIIANAFAHSTIGSREDHFEFTKHGIVLFARAILSSTESASWPAEVQPDGSITPVDPADMAHSDLCSSNWKSSNGACNCNAALLARSNAPQPEAAQPAPTNAIVYPPDGTVSPFAVINLGYGGVQIGDSIHDHRLPALWFGKEGKGMGHEEDLNREAKEGETIAVVTFANVEGLDVLLTVLQRIREKSFPDAALPLPAQQVQNRKEVHDALQKAFMTLQSSGGEDRSIVLKFNRKKNAYIVHDFLLHCAVKDDPSNAGAQQVAEQKDAERYRFLRSMIHMTDEQKEAIGDAKDATFLRGKAS
jgi:hypothetical protein